MLPMAGAHSRDPDGAAATTPFATCGSATGRRWLAAALGRPSAQVALFITWFLSWTADAECDWLADRRVARSIEPTAGVYATLLHQL